MKSGKKLPTDVIERWPEIFGEITLNVIPLRYLDTITVKFKNNKVWELNLTKNQSNNEWEEFEKNLKNLLSTYENEIDTVDFKLDTDKIKKDMIKYTNKFLKNRKLK